VLARLVCPNVGLLDREVICVQALPTGVNPGVTMRKVGALRSSRGKNATRPVSAGKKLYEKDVS